MNPQEQTPTPDNPTDELDSGAELSVDDFIRQLEAKERDLHITSDLSIEIAELDLDMSPAQSFVEQDIAADVADLSIPKPTPKRAAPASAPAKEQPAAPQKGRVLELENQLASVKLQLAELRAERADMQEKTDRRTKDFENYRYRMDREKRGAFIDMIANIATQMLPVVDNLGRAIDLVPEHAEEGDPAFRHFYDGIVLVSRQVTDVFAGMGVEPIVSVGEEFDPNLHEAVAVEHKDGTPPNTVIEEMLCGYRIGNRIIRHSMVKVTPGTPRAETAAIAAEDSRPADDSLALEDLLED